MQMVDAVLYRQVHVCGADVVTVRMWYVFLHVPCSLHRP